MKQTLLYIITAALLATVSCSSSTDPDTDQELDVQAFTINSSNYEKWVYFSFVRQDTVSVSDFQNDLSWDIAFHRADVRLNGGASGTGKAGAVSTDARELDEVTQAPTEGYTADQMGQVIMEFSLPPTYVEQPVNSILSEWLDIDTSNPPPVYTLGNQIFVIKTANGKFAKLTFTDYTNDKGETLYPTFEYVYQPDGSQNF